MTATLDKIPSVLNRNSKHNGITRPVIIVLMMILRQAARDGVIAVVPQVSVPAQKPVRHDEDHDPGDDVAEPRQVEELYEATPGPWQVMVLLAAWCQLRRGEALGPSPEPSATAGAGQNGSELPWAFHKMTSAFGEPGVWTAWGMVFNRDQENATGKKRNGVNSRHYALDPVFEPFTDAGQYGTMIERLVAQNIYDAGWRVTTWVNPDGTVGYDEPTPPPTAETLRTQVEARVKFALQSLKNA